MLKVSNVIKTYKNAKEPALKGISFDVKEGEVFGLIGKNGAGKSTTIKCLMGIHPYEKGTITIKGYDLKKNENEAKSLIGYVPDNHTVYENLSGREYLNFMADVYKVDKETRDKNIEKYAKMFNLSHALDMQISSYSHGMHQKICIMGALVHEPEMWVLDEPFLGLDHASIKNVKQCVIDYAKSKGHIVIFSSHNMDTVIDVCDRVCVIEKGNVKEILDMKDSVNHIKLRYYMK